MHSARTGQTQPLVARQPAPLIPPDLSAVTVNKRFGLALRAAPSSNAAILATVACGTPLQVVGSDAGWLRVPVGGSDAWVGSARVVRSLYPEPGACAGAPYPPYSMGQLVRAQVASGRLSIRPSPSASAPVGECVPSGHAFILTNGPVEVEGEDWFGVRSIAAGALA